jgi:PIN domain nuclease of toxin-antitoxin system
LLLDSNSLLWWLAETRLPLPLIEQLKREPSLYISLATPWELWVKAAAGRLDLSPDFDEALDGAALTILRPTLADARLAANLPQIHRDPFDRMIIAQSLNAGMTVVTSDSVFANYGCDVILV